jgi:hypothetical protein
MVVVVLQVQALLRIRAARPLARFTTGSSARKQRGETNLGGSSFVETRPAPADSRASLSLTKDMITRDEEREH